LDFPLDQLDDCALYTKLASVPVNYGYIAVVEVIEDVNWLSRADMAEKVGTGSTDRHLAGLNQFSSEGVLGSSDSHKACLCCHNSREDLEISLKDDSQWSRPEVLGQEAK